MPSPSLIPTATTLKLALVDDHPVFLEGLCSVLGRREGFSIVGLGSTADAAVELAVRQAPHVMIIDLNIPGGGLAAVREIAERCGDVRAVVLTGSDAAGDVTSALEAGAKGYVNKGTEVEELVSAIASVCRGEIYVTPRVLAQIVRPRSLRPVNLGLEDLTAREEMVIRLVSKGLTNKEIAAELGLAMVTVRNHIGRVMSKLNARNRVQACVLAADLLPGLM